MENLNIGIANLVISDKLKDSYFNNELLNESKALANDFLNVIKSSPILQLEFKVFNNIENKEIENELLATRYIDNNIKLFEIYTIDEINDEHKKLESYVKDYSVDNEKIKLYEAINNLILNSVNTYDNVDVDKIHESFITVLNHVKTIKPKNINENTDDILNEEIINIAISKFNEKYYTLHENDRELLKRIIKSNTTEKKEMFESYKKENLVILNELSKKENDNNTLDKINKTISKINDFHYNIETINESIVDLYELKKGLIES